MAALREARKHVEEAEARDKEVKQLAHKARSFRERNHISEQVNEIVWGHLGG